MESWNDDESIPNSEISKAINDLPVPEEIKYPTPGAATPVDKQADADTAAADLALDDGAGKVAPAAVRTAAKKAGPRKAAARLPKTPGKAAGATK